METSVMDKFRWRMAKWLWAPPGEMPLSDPEYAEWMKPAGRPVKNKTWHHYQDGRGSKIEPAKRIDKLYLRGGLTHHEVTTHHKHKAVMEFRGKGSKVERRSRKSKARRKEG